MAVMDAICRIDRIDEIYEMCGMYWRGGIDEIDEMGGVDEIYEMRGWGGIDEICGMSGMWWDR